MTQYKYLVVMNNGNEYKILSELEIENFLNDLYGNTEVRITSHYLTKPFDRYNAIIINSKYISEILFEGEVNE